MHCGRQCLGGPCASRSGHHAIRRHLSPFSRTPSRPALATPTAPSPLQPVAITAHKYALLAQAAAANPSWRQELAAASPSLLNRFLMLGVPRLMRMSYLLQKG